MYIASSIPKDTLRRIDISMHAVVCSTKTNFIVDLQLM